MNLTVFTGPDPVSNLDELLRRTPFGLGPVCALVPESGSVVQMERRLAGLSDDAFLGHRVFTFEGLALEMLSHYGKAPELIGEHIKLALLGEITRSRAGGHSQFHTISQYKGFLSLLVSYLRDFRSFQLGEKAENSSLFLIKLASAYDRRLKKLGKTDHEGAVARSLEGDRVERFSNLFHGPLIVDGFYDLTEVQFELLVRLFRLFRRSAVTLLYDEERPGLFALPEKLLKKYLSIDAKIAAVEYEPVNTTEQVLSVFMAGKKSEKCEEGDVQIHTFRSETAEADWMCGTIRSMIAGGVCKSEDVMIVSRVQPGYGSPIHTALKHHGIPAEEEIGRQLTHFPLIQLILDALEASIHHDDAQISRVLTSDFTGGSPSSGVISHHYQDDHGWMSYIAENDTPEGFVMSVKRMVGRLKIEKRIINFDNKQIKHSEIMVYQRFLGLLDEFVAVYSPFYRMMKAGEFKRLLEQFLENVKMTESPSIASGILAVGVEKARHIHRKVVFITGLDNASFPKKHDTFTLHSSQRGRSIRENREYEESLLFYLSGTGAERLYLTFPGIDDEGKDASMSPYLEEICRAASSWSKPVFHYGIPGAAWEGGVVDNRGRSENIIRALQGNFSEAHTILSSIRKRDKSLEQHLTMAITDYIGLSECSGMSLEEPVSHENIVKTWGTERVFSVTGLERYISCPSRFFLSYILGLSIDHFEEDEISALEMGSMIHEICAVFYTTRKERYGRTSFERSDLHDCKILMKEIIERIITRNLVPARRLSPVILKAEKKHMLSWMEVFLEKEAEYFEEYGFEPAYFELDFGRPPNKSGQEFDALELEHEGHTVRIGGRIDRIDIGRSKNCKRVRIIDYKTGSRNTPISEIEEGTVLQIPLYLKAAVESIVPGGVPHDGVYYTFREMEMKGYRKNREPILGSEWDSYIDIAVRSACSAAQGIREGHFPHKPGKCDEYCEFKALCTSARTGMVNT